jgi:hypothetical protein
MLDHRLQSRDLHFQRPDDAIDIALNDRNDFGAEIFGLFFG